jgi:hypothetical protein
MMFLSIVPSDPNLIQFIAAMNKVGSVDGFKNTQNNFENIVNGIASSWRKSAGNKYEVQTFKHSPFSHSIFSNESMMKYLEEGLPSYDMRKTHPYGKKSRVSKKGIPYLVIQFRHGIKSGGRFNDSGFSDIYRKLLYQINIGKFQRSTVIKSANGSGKIEKNAMGQMIERAEYDWGSRYEPKITDKMTEEQKATAERLKGLVAFSGSYMTFRIVSANSKEGSWKHPGIKARHYLRDIVLGNQEKIKNIIEESLKMDVGL